MKGNRTALLGLALGLVGAVLLGLFVAGSGGEAEAEETVAALIVTDTLPADLTAEGVAGRVREAQVPVSLAPERRVEALDEVAGQRVLRTVGVGEIVTFDQFGGPGPSAGGFVVEPGYEAMSVEAEPAPGGEGYVTPGSKVNVYGVLHETTVDPATGEETATAYTQLVLGHVNVLAVTRGTLTGESTDPATQAQQQGRIILLLELRPSDAPVMIFAQTQGALWFTMVNDDDPAPTSQRVEIDALDPALRTGEIQAAVTEQDAREAAAEAAGADSDDDAEGDDDETEAAEPDDE